MQSREPDDIPQGYQRHVISDVIRHDDSLTIKYSGRTFGGVMLAELPQGIADHVVPGTVLIVRYHTDETGGVGLVAHMLIPNPFDDGWAELYEDM